MRENNQELEQFLKIISEELSNNEFMEFGNELCKFTTFIIYSTLFHLAEVVFFDSEIKAIINVLNLCVYTLIFGKTSLKSMQDSVIIGFYVGILYMKGHLLDEHLLIDVTIP